MSVGLAQGSDNQFQWQGWATSAWQWLRSVPMAWWRLLVLLVSLAWLCQSAAQLFWMLFPAPVMPEPARIAQTHTPATSLTPDSAVDLAALQALQLFGDPSSIVEQAVEPEVATDIPDDIATTNLNLKLHGVIASNDEKAARAIIDNGKSQQVYGIGDEIDRSRNVKLAKVHPQRVIIDNQGRFESLWLYSEEDFKASEAARQRYVPMDQDDDEEKDAGINTVNVTAKPSQIPKTIGDVVRFSVHRKDGRMVGYRVRPGRDQELFEQVGLQTNDVVTSVNGIAIDDPRKIREVYQSLKTATSAQLNVLREEENYTINISLDANE